MVACEGRSEELETFHRVLHDLSYGVASEEVQQFVVDACRVPSAAGLGLEQNF